MPTNFGPNSAPSPRIRCSYSVGVVAFCIMWVAFLVMLTMLGGCTGKSIKLYSPTSGKPLAEYNNTTDSEIGGLEAEYDPTTGAFKVKVKSSAQSASSSNEAAFAAIQSAIDKIPTP